MSGIRVCERGFVFEVGEGDHIHTRHSALICTHKYTLNTDLDDRPPHLALGQPFLAVRLDEGRLMQEHARDRGEIEKAGEGEEEDKAVHC